MDDLQNKEERLSRLKGFIEDLETLGQDVDPQLRKQMRKLEREIAVLRRLSGSNEGHRPF